jgi:hypothetical protein
MKHCQTLAVKSNIYRKGRVKQSGSDSLITKHPDISQTPGRLIAVLN